MERERTYHITPLVQRKLSQRACLTVYWEHQGWFVANWGASQGLVEPEIVVGITKTQKEGIPFKDGERVVLPDFIDYLLLPEISPESFKNFNTAQDTLVGEVNYTSPSEQEAHVYCWVPVIRVDGETTYSPVPLISKDVDREKARGLVKTIGEAKIVKKVKEDIYNLKQFKEFKRDISQLDLLLQRF